MSDRCRPAAVLFPMRILALGLDWRCSADCVASRVPPRRAGNFHLRPQMKVTKAKGLKATPFGSFFALRRPGPAGHFDTPPRIEPTTRSTRPRFASAWGPADLRGRGFARPAPSSAPQVRCAASSPSRPPDRGSGACRTSERCCIQPLCFGDFHLGPQMKVTRPPGRDPAGWHAANSAKKHNLTKGRAGSISDPRSPSVHCMRRGPVEALWST